MMERKNIKSEYICLGPKRTKQMNKLDNLFLNFDNSVNQVFIPSLIKESILKKCGYFDTFPQHLTCAIPYAKKEEDNYYLTPAACLHIYPMIANGLDFHNQTYTALESVYRYENGNFSQDERLWEFTVREFVFVGQKKYVLGKLDLYREKALKIAKKVNSAAKIEAAYDNFYPTKENKIKQKIQLANNMKDELLVPYQEREIAIASFNFHGTHFSYPFGFDENGETVTGCVGFGMERWVLFCNENETNSLL